jgi:hypothetical protein
MKLKTITIDLAKNVFQVCGVNKIIRTAKIVNLLDSQQNSFGGTAVAFALISHVCSPIIFEIL